jgi:hypothetical protein
MKLIYRGATYDYDPTQSQSRFDRSVQRAQSLRQLIYRGFTYQVDPSAQFAEVPAPAAYDLHYRGTTYHVNRAAEGTTVAVKSASGVGKAVSVPNTLPRRYVNQHIEQVHQENLLKKLQHRIDVAKNRGDQELISLLEAELQQLAPGTRLSV